MKIKRFIVILISAILALSAMAFASCGEETSPKERTLESIIVSGGFKTDYTEGQNFDPDGMIVTAKYSDETTEKVNAYTFTPNGALTVNDKTVTVSYTEGGVTRTCTVNIKVTAQSKPEPEAELASVEITTLPAKTEYKAGESFDPAGMVVTASYTKGKASAAVTGFTFSPSGALTSDVNVITISYTEDGVTKTTTVGITVTEEVVKNLSSIAITKAPDKTDYVAGEWFDITGMEVTAYYDDESSAVVTDYTTKPGHGNFASMALREDDGDSDKEVTISYTENGVTKTAVQDITVTPATAEAPAKLRNGDRYEAEYAAEIVGTNANGKPGFVRGDKNCIGGMARTGNYVTFKVVSDKAESGVTMTVCLAAMNTTTDGKTYEHRETAFDDVYRLSVNGTELLQGPDLKFGFEGKKDQWFDWVEVELTIDLIEGENVIKFTVPDLPDYAPDDTIPGDYSLYIGSNFNYISFKTESASLTYVPEFGHSRW